MEEAAAGPAQHRGFVRDRLADVVVPLGPAIVRVTTVAFELPPEVTIAAPAAPMPAASSSSTSGTITRAELRRGLVGTNSCVVPAECESAVRSSATNSCAEL